MPIGPDGKRSERKAGWLRGSRRRFLQVLGLSAGGLWLGTTPASASQAMTIDNGTAQVNISPLQLNEFLLNGNETVYEGAFGVQEDDGDVAFTTLDGSVTDGFPDTGEPGTPYTATVELTLGDGSGNTVGQVAVDRTVTLDTADPVLTNEYCIENVGSQRLGDLNLYQYVDYDIVGISDDFGAYVESPFEYIYQADDGGIHAGFSGEAVSENHDVDEFFELGNRIEDYPNAEGPLLNDDRFPDSGTADATVALQWSLGSLAVGERTCFTVTFAAASSQTELEASLPGQVGQGVFPGPLFVDGKRIGPPRDIDEDDEYEDVDGDGELSDGDLNAFRDVIDAYEDGRLELDSSQVAALDFDDDGDLDYEDLVALTSIVENA